MRQGRDTTQEERVQIVKDCLDSGKNYGEMALKYKVSYRRTNIVKSEKFSEIIQSAMNRYLNGMLTNEEVIQELLKLAKDIAAAAAEGEKLGLTADELAFYDALTKPQAIKDFYEHDELIAITKELTDLLRKNRTILRIRYALSGLCRATQSISAKT